MKKWDKKNEVLEGISTQDQDPAEELYNRIGKRFPVKWKPNGDVIFDPANLPGNVSEIDVAAMLSDLKQEGIL